MKVIIAQNSPEINSAPLYKMILDESLVLEFDDIEEKRWKITFSPYQSVKVTTIDCFDSDIYLIEDAVTIDKEFGRQYHNYIFEVINSPWINDLNKKSKNIDDNSDFMDDSHHYILPLGDDVVEIAAWDNFILEKL